MTIISLLAAIVSPPIETMVSHLQVPNSIIILGDLIPSFYSIVTVV